MHIWSLLRPIPRIHRNPARNGGVSQADQSILGDAIPIHFEGHPKSDWTSSRAQPFPLVLNRLMQALFQGHQEGKNKQVRQRLREIISRLEDIFDILSATIQSGSSRVIIHLLGSLRCSSKLCLHTRRVGGPTAIILHF